MQDRRVILVFGAPGVGKTTLVKQFIHGHPEWVRISGGDMICKGLKEEERDSLRDTSLAQVELNQKRLVENFQAELRATQKSIIFDGHCFVRLSTGADYPIPVDVIAGLNPTQIVLITASPETIIHRRENDSLRPNREVESISEIEERQKANLNACETYSDQLNAPLIVLNSPSENDFKAALLA